MHEFLWLDHLPGSTLEGGIELANRLHSNITWALHDQQWYIWSGECLLLRTDTKEVAEAFLYGLGLAYAVLPEDVFEQLEKDVKRWVGE